MIDRYCLPKMKSIWSDENKFKKWLEVEIAIAEGWLNLGVIPKSAVEKIKRSAKIDIKRISEIEKETRHDVIAFVKQVSETVGEEGKFIHYGVTSYDVVDTALSLLMKESSDIILHNIKNLMKVILKKAKVHKGTVMIGRTHGVHAEPITFGFKLLIWHYEMERNLKRMEFAKEMISYGKISGAVGTYANIPPEIEKFVCRKLGLKPAKISTQILQRDRHARFITTIAIIASSVEKFATEVRNLQRTEILECEEPFREGQRGSSAMPHKRNPIICEQISGLARVIRGNCLTSLENISLWHERDLTNSAPERIIIPDTCLLIDYILNKFTEVLENLIVHKDNMKRNLDKTKGIISSQKVMLKLVEKGISREDAYKLIQEKAMTSFLKNEDFKTHLLEDKKITDTLTEYEIGTCLDLNNYLNNLKKVFKRFKI